MLSFQLDTLSSKTLFKDVLVRLINGNELTLNYFELKSKAVTVPFHEHPVEHLIVVLQGEVEFMFKGHRLSLKERNGLFLPANTRHSARVVRAPVKALEIYNIAEDKYYEQ
ncbi:cupin domain-containing protein [Candidatus Bathyarchaeota archaeon]|nr:cupin domain-containing protein [Candidatus Bathyarchaeota archaeon]